MQWYQPGVHGRTNIFNTKIICWNLTMSNLLLCVLVLLPIIGSISGEEDLYRKMSQTPAAFMKLAAGARTSSRVKRAACDTQEALTCIQRTTDTYLTSMFDSNSLPKPIPAGEKPDYQERKTCNFLLDSAKCFDFLEHCGLDADEFNQIKETSLAETRKHARMLPNWDDSKCQLEGQGASFQWGEDQWGGLLLFASFLLV